MLYNALNQMKAKSLDPGKYSDGQGLWLIKRSKTAGKWVLRLSQNGKRREMGLGRWPDVGIAEAREHAQKARQKMRNGHDPIEERRKQQRIVKRVSLKEAIEGCFTARQAELKGDGVAGRWMSPLTTHVIPKIGDHPVEDIDQHELKQLLEPIWHKKSNTAEKALNRLNLTLKYAAALGLDVDLQAPMKARALLGKQRHQVKHIPSLPYQEMPRFYTWLKAKDQMSALALRFLILTAARTSEVRLARYDEIDGDVWTLPSNRTKTGQIHRVPLTAAAVEILETCEPWSQNGLVFPSKRGKAMSDMAMSTFMRREGFEARPHGFRATFRTWVEEQTNTPYEVKETALGHKVDSKTVAAYQRSDRLEKRRKLLQDWSDFLISAHY